MAIASTQYSRFKETETVVKDGVETYGLWKRPKELYEENLSSSDIIQISVGQAYAGRPDMIANDYYGTPILEWAIVMFNRPLNTIGWPTAGSVIKIPSRQSVMRLL